LKQQWWASFSTVECINFQASILHPLGENHLAATNIFITMTFLC